MPQATRTSPPAARRGRTKTAPAAARVEAVALKVRRSAPAIAFGAVRLAGRFTAAERVTIDALMRQEIDFVDSPEFRRPGAQRRILVDPAPVPRADTGWYQPLLGEHGDRGDRGSSRAPGRGVVLTGAQERVIFSQFNYARFRAAQVQRRLGRDGAKATLARELLHWHERSEAIRTQIAETNLALVLAMAKRVRSADLDFGDLISEGNMALLRSVDKFDFSRGFKFSTYACRAILKAFSRLGIKTQRHRKHFPGEFDPELERGDHVAEVRMSRESDTLRAMSDLIAHDGAGLTPMEHSVIFHRYGLDRPVDSSQMTLEQVGGILGVTKERVRQIQQSALEKLRLALADPQPRRDDLAHAVRLLN